MMQKMVFKAAKPNKNIHSSLHGLIDELRTEFGETAQKGKGSFGFYLGLLRRVPVGHIHEWRSLAREKKILNGEAKGRFFWACYRNHLSQKGGKAVPTP